MQLCPDHETPKPSSRLTRIAFGGICGHLIPAILVLIPFALTLLVALLLRHEHYYELSLINAPKTLNTVSYILSAIAGVLGICGLRASNKPHCTISPSASICYLIAALICLVFPEVFHVTTEAVFLRASQVFPMP
jgi:hypothetical protein